MNLMDTPDERNSCDRASVELHSRCSSSGSCHSSLVSMKSKKESIVSGSICALSSGMIAGRVSLDDSRLDNGYSIFEIMDGGEACCLESSLSESAGDTISMKSIASNAFLVKNLAICGDVRDPRTLRSVSFADPWTERYVQRENGARCCRP